MQCILALILILTPIIIFFCYRLQKFKLMTANTVISADNASINSMATEQVRC